MSKSSHHPRASHAESLQPSSSPPDREEWSGDKPALRDARDTRNLLERILSTQHIERIVPRLQPELLHRVIQNCGLEDCGELVALVTPEQLAGIFDLDLWRAARSGQDEQFDGDRFGVWLEVLLEAGAAQAAQKLAGMDVDLVAAGLAQHALVYDRAAVTPYESLDGEQMDAIRVDDDRLSAEIGGYLLVARREDSWEAIVEVLMALESDHPDYFHRAMRGCRALSNSRPEVDGLHDLLPNDEQVMFDLAVDRERRREKQGYVTPAQARAFLQMSRRIRLGRDFMPPANPLAHAYFREIEKPAAGEPDSRSALSEKGATELPAPEEGAEAVEAAAEVFDALREAGIIAPPPRALLGSSEEQPQRLSRLQTLMQFVLDYDETVYSLRSEELVYLANTLVAGCSIQSRPFTPQEALDAAAAVCNLGIENWGIENWGIENWPARAHSSKAAATAGSFLVDHDLVSVFQVGWTVLYNDVCMFAAEQLLGVLRQLRCDDREIQAGLDALRTELARRSQSGEPWRARDALDVIASLDMPAWAALLALIDEYPVLHAGIAAAANSGALSVSASDFEFISENSQIASVREFLRALPERLRP